MKNNVNKWNGTNIKLYEDTLNDDRIVEVFYLKENNESFKKAYEFIYGELNEDDLLNKSVHKGILIEEDTYTMLVKYGDYIIKDKFGGGTNNIYPYKSDYFHKRYMKISDILDNKVKNYYIYGKLEDETDDFPEYEFGLFLVTTNCLEYSFKKLFNNPFFYSHFDDIDFDFNESKTVGQYSSLIGQINIKECTNEEYEVLKKFINKNFDFIF